MKLLTWLGCISLCIVFWVLVLIYAGGAVAFMLMVAGILFICYLAEGQTKGGENGRQDR